jgi:plastocyanin
MAESKNTKNENTTSSLLHASTLWLAVMLLITGCASSSGTVKGTHTVRVGQQIDPIQVNAGRGDEVRWKNDRSQPIALVFPATDLSRISCRSGFQVVDRTVLSAVVPPNASASLCFAEQGKYDYQVRLDQNIASAQTDRNASVWVSGRGSRNPKPGEQFENINP